MGVELDLSITIGNLLEVGVIAVGGISTITVMRQRLIWLANEIVAYKKGTTEAMKDLTVATTTEFLAVKDELKKLGEILVNQADQNRRIIHLEDDIREMKHGRGYVEGPRGIGGIGN